MITLVLFLLINSLHLGSEIQGSNEEQPQSYPLNGGINLQPVYPSTDSSFKRKSCEVVINGVDLATKVDGRIIGYKGSTNDRESLMTRSVLKVLKRNGAVKIEMVMVPLNDRRYREQVNCESNFRMEVDTMGSGMETDQGNGSSD